MTTPAEIVAKAFGHEKVTDHPCCTNCGEGCDCPLIEVDGCDACAGDGWPCRVATDAIQALSDAGYVVVPQAEHAERVRDVVVHAVAVGLAAERLGCEADDMLSEAEEKVAAMDAHLERQRTTPGPEGPRGGGEDSKRERNAQRLSERDAAHVNTAGNMPNQPAYDWTGVIDEGDEQ